MADIANAALGATIGLAAKAGKLVCGTPMICEALAGKGKRPVLVLEARDTSENTGKRLRDKCLFYKTRHEVLPMTMDELSSFVGKRALIAAVGVCDDGLAKAILKKLDTADAPTRSAE